MIFVSYPTAAPRISEMYGEMSLRKDVRRRGSVDVMIIKFASSVAQDVREGPVVR